VLYRQTQTADEKQNRIIIVIIIIIISMALSFADCCMLQLRCHCSPEMTSCCAWRALATETRLRRVGERRCEQTSNSLKYQ